MRFFKIGVSAVSVGILVLFAMGVFDAPTSFASDHFEAPLVQQHKGADITDVYIFDTVGDTVTMIVCFAGFTGADLGTATDATYDKDVLYTLNIDTNMDNKTNHAVQWRYGTNNAGDWGVSVANIPGVDATIVGAVDTALGDGGTKVWTGNADDPFFFDAVGYLTTLRTGSLGLGEGETPSFDNTRDFLAGMNVTSMVIQVPVSAFGGSESIQVWATTHKHIK